MAFSNTVKSQVIALMNLSERDVGTNLPVYADTISGGGDTIYSQEEVDQAVASAMLSVMQAICETDGHPDRVLFVQPEPLAHGEILPTHYGSIGVPRVTPYLGAGYKMGGKRKTVEEIQAYRKNPGGYYSATNHDAQAAGGLPSKLAGYYAVDEAAQVVYFTGASAEADLAYFEPADGERLPDRYLQLATSLAIVNLYKDGNVSDIFAAHQAIAANDLDSIRNLRSDQPSLKKTVGARESGAV